MIIIIKKNDNNNDNNNNDNRKLLNAHNRPQPSQFGFIAITTRQTKRLETKKTQKIIIIMIQIGYKNVTQVIIIIIKI